MGRPSCQSSLLSDRNANFSLEMSRRSNIKEGRHVGLDFYDLLIEALIKECSPWIFRGTSADTAIPGNGPSHSFSGSEQRNTPRNVYCVFIEMCLEPCLKIRLPV